MHPIRSTRDAYDEESEPNGDPDPAVYGFWYDRKFNFWISNINYNISLGVNRTKKEP